MIPPKKCKSCSELLPLSDFKLHKEYADGHTNRCKKCLRLIYASLPAKRITRKAKRCSRCETVKPIASFRSHAGHADGHYAHCKACEKRQWDSARDETYAAYGGYKCACCGEAEPLFLSVDHVANNGGEHRKREIHARKLVEYLKRRRFPKGYQILCWNCQMGKARNGGICPHKNKARK
jgi:hypothetical protein